MSNAPSASTPLEGVRVDLTGSRTEVTVTDANGNYSFTVPAGGDYTVTPSGQGKTYEPLSRSFTNVTANITNADFLAFGPGVLERRLTVRTTNVVPPSNTAAVPIILTALGDERKLSFSLSYDTARLSSPVVTCGPDAPGCVIMVNNSSQGSVGIMVTLAELPAPGDRRIVTVTFSANSGGNANTPILFTDVPTLLSTTNSAGDPLATGYTGGFVVFTATGLEGDVAPRFNGDGLHRSTDVEQERRFVSGIDATNSLTNEYQRADTAPFASKGDGRLRADDFQLVVNYTAQLAPIQTAGGPVGPAGPAEADDLLGKSSGREVRAGEVKGSRGEFVEYPIEMMSNGEVTALTFGLQFDPSHLSISDASGTNVNPDVLPGAGVEQGISITVNGKYAHEGRIGVLIDLNGRSPAGSGAVVVFRFRVLPGAPAGITPIEFADRPASLSASDADARDLPVRFTPGGVFVRSSARSGDGKPEAAVSHAYPPPAEVYALREAIAFSGRRFYGSVF